ncbi:MAG: hypothetical protein KAS93_05480 [Gammaproteobacteria bacterium]|nr:hypothetical protein [Gammaproteobacteria bacterium]
MREYTKKIKRQLRELVGVAYKRELESTLTGLEQQFGEIDCWDLGELIHIFHNKDARNLYKQYEMGGDASWKVAYAVNNAILKKEELSDEVMGVVGDLIKDGDSNYE